MGQLSTGWALRSVGLVSVDWVEASLLVIALLLVQGMPAVDGFLLGSGDVQVRAGEMTKVGPVPGRGHGEGLRGRHWGRGPGRTEPTFLASRVHDQGRTSQIPVGNEAAYRPIGLGADHA